MIKLNKNIEDLFLELILKSLMCALFKRVLICLAVFYYQVIFN